MSIIARASKALNYLYNSFINQRNLVVLGKAVVIICFIISLTLTINHIFAPLTNITDEEEDIVFPIEQIISGHSVYSSPESIPYSINQYTPVYYYTCALTCKALRVEPEKDIRKIYIICRSISALFRILSIVIIGLIGIIILGFTGKMASYAAAISYICTNPWNALARPDAMESFFFFLSILLFLMYLKKREKLHSGAYLTLFMALIASLLAIFTKQSSIVLIAIYIIYLFLILDVGALLRCLLIYGIFFLILFTYLYHTHAGHLMKENVIDGVNNGFLIGLSLQQAYFPAFLEFSVLFSVAAIAIIHFKNEINKFLKFLSVSLFILLIFYTGIATKAGASINYYLNFFSISILTAGVLYDKITNEYKNTFVINYIKIFCFSYFIFFISFFCLENVYDHFYFSSHLNSSYNGYKHLISNIQSESLQNTQLKFISLNNKGLNVCLPNNALIPQIEVYQIAYSRGLISNINLKNELSKESTLIIMYHNQVLPPELFGISLNNYTLKDSADGFFIYSNKLH